MQPFADIQKTFGAHGELIIKLWTTAPEEINTTEPVFVVFDGLPVPFYFKSFEARGNNRALVVFDDMESQKLAEELVGKKLLLPDNHKQPDTGEEEALTGFSVTDKQHGLLGIVTGYMDIPGNPCLQVEHKGKELIIPFNEAIVLCINRKKRTLETALPEGLLALS
jgi:16S rRNA processing protein RimM